MDSGSLAMCFKMLYFSWSEVESDRMTALEFGGARSNVEPG